VLARTVASFIISGLFGFSGSGAAVSTSVLIVPPTRLRTTDTAWSWTADGTPARLTICSISRSATTSPRVRCAVIGPDRSHTPFES
jgi:hypothetical protein